MKNNLDYNRYGFVTSKKVGNAVVRNRVRRLFREFFYKEDNIIKSGYDIVLISKKVTGIKIKEIKFENVKKDILKVLKKSGVLK